MDYSLELQCKLFHTNIAMTFELKKEEKSLRLGEPGATAAYFRLSDLPASFSQFRVALLDNFDFLLLIIPPCTEKPQQCQRLRGESRAGWFLV
jgi:hypothetical protein